MPGARRGGPGQTDLNAAVSTAVEFLERQGQLKGCNLALHLESGLACVQGDRHGLEQVVINLLMNALQAAPGGSLSVGTVAGAVLYVADQGPGVADEDRERIFDPFFTTKPPGEGTGLGLAIVARTVDDAGGMVWVDRAREGGAVFKVFLPLAGATDALVDR